MAHIYRQGAQWQKMAETLQQALNVAVANDDRKVILVDLGQLLDKHMQEREQAVNYFRRALEVDPYYLPALDALERIYTENEEHEELASGGALPRHLLAFAQIDLVCEVGDLLHLGLRAP